MTGQNKSQISSNGMVFIILMLICINIVMLIHNRVVHAETDGWDGKTVESYAEGDGTKENPYQISKPEHLAYLAKMVNAGEPYIDTYFLVTEDIDLNNKKWTAIGNTMTEFQGYFDGDLHTISNLYIKKTKKAQGLFAYTVGAEITKIKLSGVNIKGETCVGGLIGIAKNTKLIQCTVAGTISGTENVGGLVGSFGDDTAVEYIKSSVNKAKVTGTKNVGGIAGYGLGRVYKSNNYGDIYGTQFVGGIIGLGMAEACVNHGSICGVQDIGGMVGMTVFAADLAKCVNLGTIIGSIEVGGIAGNLIDGSKALACSNYGAITGTERVGGICGVGNFKQVYNCGVVTGTQYVGGISGYAYNGISTAAYNTGKVVGGKTGVAIGGIIGYLQESETGSGLQDSYSTGKITGKKQVGGVVGYNGGAVTNTFYKVNTAKVGIGKGNKGTARPKEAADMKKASFLTLLNVTETNWKQKSGKYPTLTNCQYASSSNKSTAQSVNKISGFAGDPTKSKITLSWTAQMRLTGYEIYQYNKTKKKYVKLATIDSIDVASGSISQHTVTKLKSKTTYKFRIRGYKQVANKKYYGKYVTISVKTK